ncbi:MAG: L-asparaginase [Alphaproteobacteria bacterium]|jgi:L-asparaginase|nr:L-asparaginase [Alphaproteobacteria bacterium]
MTDDPSTSRPVTKVLVLYTGGTIGMVPADESNPASPLRPAPKDRLIKFVPLRLKGRAADIIWDIEGLTDENGEPVGPLDSSKVGPKHWKLMATAIGAAYEKYDGFVILHGTDTMAYTASALSFLLQNLGKPVIITGSQLPIFQPRTDAVMNFINALNIAGYRADGLMPLVPEVAICFGTVLLRGNRTTKVSTSRWQGFDTPNYPHLGQIGERIVIDKTVLRQVPAGSFTANPRMKESVATIPLYPGMAAKVLGNMLKLDVDGFILRTFGAGNAPDDSDFLNTLKEAIDAGKIVVNTTQCLEGTVEQGHYEASSGLQNVGVITGLDLTPEAALTKLMWLLEEDPAEAALQMQINQRGEQSGSSYDVPYGEVGKGGTFVDIGKLAQRPARDLKTDSLERAVLRISALEMEDAKTGEPVSIAIFVNLNGANADTPTSVPQFAGYLSGTYEGPKKTTLVRDITPTLKRVNEEGRTIYINLVPPAGKRFRAHGAYLTLFTD